MKRRQRHVWAGLLSVETDMVRSVEAVLMAEDNTGRAALARHDRASRRLRTQVRTYVLRRDLRGLCAVPVVPGTASERR